MSKKSYSDFFAQCKNYLKIGKFADDCNISRSALSKFCKGDPFLYEISLEQCEKLYNSIVNYCKKIG